MTTALQRIVATVVVVSALNAAVVAGTGTADPRPDDGAASVGDTATGIPSAEVVRPDGVALSVTASATPVENGTTTVTVTVTNEGTNVSVAPAAQVRAPANWTVVDRETGNATYRSATREFLWLTLDAGESVTANATFAVADSFDGRARIPIHVGDARNHTAQTAVRLGDWSNTTTESTTTATTSGSRGGLLGPLLLPLALVVVVVVGLAGLYASDFDLLRR